jgi:ketosteroid isomerase-like protein
MQNGTVAALVTLVITSAAWGGRAQEPPRGPAGAELMKMVNTERAFVQRAQETNWRDAFLEFFADGIKGFDGEDVKARLRSRPEPPKDLEFWWEPRYGDMAASGELGWLTGPVRTRLPQVAGGKPDFANYTSIWKRQPDGTYKVIQDVGVTIPAMAPFPPGFARAPVTSRYAGPEKGAQAQDGLRAADARLTAALCTAGVAEAYADVAAPFARLHRDRVMPIVGREAIASWSLTQPAWSTGETRFAEVAESGDLGYSWGSYAQPATAGTGAAIGYYLRIWTRDAQARWRLVVEVTQRKPAAQ